MSTSDDLQNALQAAAAKACKTYNGKLKPSIHKLLEALTIQSQPITSTNLAIKYNWDEATVSNVLAAAARRHQITRTPCPLPGKAKWEYSYNPSTTAQVDKSAPYLTLERRYTLHIHGCSATFTREELINLRRTISSFLEDNQA